MNNGNSFGGSGADLNNGASACVTDSRATEPWWFRVMRPMPDPR